MKQHAFEAQGRERWAQLEALLDGLDRGDAVDTEAFPQLYRRVCQDLALARDRQFSPLLVERLNRLALRGHHHLYRARRGGLAPVMAFLAHGFPRTVRAEWRLVAVNALLFYGTLLTVGWLIQDTPELAHSLLGSEMLNELERMYDPASPRHGPQADDRFMMFGFYIWNNISIAFRTFASGLMFGVGTLFIAVYNALFIGATFGHLIRIGSGEPILTFAIAHGAPELNAIVLAGAAGMRLGLGLLAPGNRSRRQALRDSGRRALPLVYGAGAMLLLAAGIEAFWSPQPLDPGLKYAVGASLWGAVGLYFVLAGRSRAD